MEKLKNGRLSEKDNLAFTCHWRNPPRTRPRKAKMQIALAVFHCPDPMQMKFEAPAASVLFLFLLFNIAYAIYHTCDIYHICDIEK